MKKAVVVGGSNGIGLAISKRLIDRGYYIEICDLCEPDSGTIDEENYHYSYCNLLDFDENLIYKLANDYDIDVLVVTAGIGRVADFQYHHIAEIDKILTIDTVSTLKLLSIFYNRILNEKPFYTAVMGSISGWISSPSATVYSAAKAAVVRFVESVNVELEVSGVSNRILDISPGFFGGSKFYGGKNDLSITVPFAENILKRLFEKDMLYIPQYEEVYRNVIERYQNDHHEYGIYSYLYKKNSGRLNNRKQVKIGYLSGTFDLFHIGHLNLLRRAKQQCDYLIVGVHGSGAWKGKETFIPLAERKEIVAACKYVDKVVDSCKEDSDAWDLWHYDRLFVGSDYRGTERFNRYEDVLGKKGVEIIYFPYTQSTSSTQLRRAISEHKS